MRNIKLFAMIFALMCVFTLTVCADDWFQGDWDDLTPSESEEQSTTLEETTTEPVTTEPADTEASAEGDTSEPEVSGSEEETTEPDASESETAAPEESVTADETTTPVEQTTEQRSEQTTSVVEQPTETETQTADDEGGIPMALILAGLAVLGVACLALVVMLIIKYFRAQKA